ncbi:MAG TPA: DUF3828 domain-containing protein [Pyrinomonadaceae bacterium]
MNPLRKTTDTVRITAAVALLAALVLSALSASDARAQAAQSAAASAERAAESFYRYHFARDRGFVRANIVQRRRRLSPELYRLMLNEFRREAAFRKARPDEVPFMTGDPFTNAQEYPDTFAVGRATVRGSRATVPVTFGWRGVAEKRTLQIDLLNQGGRWLIHDVRREGDAGLLKLLRRPVYESDGR